MPAYIAMFVTGEWITSKEGLGGEDDPAWFVIGIVGGDLTGLLLAVSIVLAGIASWKSNARASAQLRGCFPRSCWSHVWSPSGR